MTVTAEQAQQLMGLYQKLETIRTTFNRFSQGDDVAVTSHLMARDNFHDATSWGYVISQNIYKPNEKLQDHVVASKSGGRAEVFSEDPAPVETIKSVKRLMMENLAKIGNLLRQKVSESGGDPGPEFIPPNDGRRKFAVLVGDIIEGFKAYGTFDNIDEATEWVKKNAPAEGCVFPLNEK